MLRSSLKITCLFISEINYWDEEHCQFLYYIVSVARGWIFVMDPNEMTRIM